MALRIELSFPEVTDLNAAFEVHRADLSDALSELYQLDLVAFSAHPDIDPRSLLGLVIDVRFLDEALLPRIAGIVRQARRDTPEPTGVTGYRLSVVPPEWLLTRARQMAIYQDRSGPDMVADVIARHGGRIPTPESLPPARVREYGVQFGETDHDFVFRVLSEDGVTTLRDHANNKWILTDDTRSGAIAFDDAVEWNPSNLKPAGLAVLRWSEIVDVETGTVTRRDYDFTKPGFVLQARAAERDPVPAEASLEDYDYAVGRFAVDAEGKEIIGARLSSARATVRRLRLETNFAAGAGSRFHVKGPNIEGDWLVVRSHTFLESAADGRTALRHELVVISAETPFLPREWPRMRAHGVQTAFVVGDTPPGTVDTDQYGRVKVEFRWDRRDLGKGNPTRWVRVSQAWAGAGFGFVTLPRVGDEVLVAYSDGNPEQPIIVGRVHNAVSATPLSLPEEQKSVSVWKSQSFGPSGPVDGYNFIFMDDTAGKEMLAFRAQRDLSGLVLKDVHLDVKGHVKSNIVGNYGGGIQGDHSLSIDGDCDIDVSGDVKATLGSLDVTAKAHMFLRTNDLREDQSVNHIVRAGAFYVHGKDGVQFVTPKLHAHCDEIVLQAGGSSIKITKGSIEIHSDGVIDVKGSLIKLNS